jgi:FKBP-type peptidyl-prolyl cis-trans isomerase
MQAWGKQDVDISTLQRAGDIAFVGRASIAPSNQIPMFTTGAQKLKIEVTSDPTVAPTNPFLRRLGRDSKPAPAPISAELPELTILDVAHLTPSPEVHLIHALQQSNAMMDEDEYIPMFQTTLAAAAALSLPIRPSQPTTATLASIEQPMAAMPGIPAELDTAVTVEPAAAGPVAEATEPRTSAPSDAPTEEPTAKPSAAPSDAPTDAPSAEPQTTDGNTGSDPAGSDPVDSSASEQADVAQGKQALLTILKAGLIQPGLHDRIAQALDTPHPRVPWLSGLLARASADLGRADVKPLLTQIKDVVAEITAPDPLGLSLPAGAHTPHSALPTQVNHTDNVTNEPSARAEFNVSEATADSGLLTPTPTLAKAAQQTHTLLPSRRRTRPPRPVEVSDAIRPQSAPSVVPMQNVPRALDSATLYDYDAMHPKHNVLSTSDSVSPLAATRTVISEIGTNSTGHSTNSSSMDHRLDSTQGDAALVELTTAASDGTTRKRREGDGSDEADRNITIQTEMLSETDAVTVQSVTAVNATSAANLGPPVDSEASRKHDDASSTISVATSRVPQDANHSSEPHAMPVADSSTTRSENGTQSVGEGPPRGGAHAALPELTTELPTVLPPSNVTAVQAPAVEPVVNAETLSAQPAASMSTAASSRTDVQKLHGLPGLRYKAVLDQGSGGDRPSNGDIVRITYVGRLLDGTTFDTSADHGLSFQFRVGAASRALRGWDAAVRTMRRGERALVGLAPEYAYGEAGLAPLVGANTEVEFEITLVSFDSSPAAGTSLVPLRSMAHAWLVRCCGRLGRECSAHAAHAPACHPAPLCACPCRPTQVLARLGSHSHPSLCPIDSLRLPMELLAATTSASTPPATTSTAANTPAPSVAARTRANQAIESAIRKGKAVDISAALAEHGALADAQTLSLGERCVWQRALCTQ